MLNLMTFIQQKDNYDGASESICEKVLWESIVYIISPGVLQNPTNKGY